MKMKTLLATLALLASLGTANAAPMTATDWMKLCDNKKSIGSQMICHHYTTGVAEGLHLWKAGHPENAPVCFPGDVHDSDVLVAVVRKYFKNNPKDRHLKAAAFLGLAFIDAWPCP